MIIAILVVLTVLGTYHYYPATQPRKKLVVDFWYESSGHYPQSADQAVMIKTQLERTGLITVNLLGADWPSYKENRYAESMPLYMGAWSPDYVDPDNYIYPFLHSRGGGWLHTGYNNSEADRLIEKARVSSDPETRKQLYDQIQRMSVDDAPIIPIFQSQAWAVTKPDIRGVVLDITLNLYYWLIESPRDTLIVGTTDSVSNSIDVAEAYDFLGQNLIMNTGGGLVYIKPGSEGGPEDIIPGLATSWSSSSDGLTFVFNLRQGVKFSDGTEFDAYAVKYSFDRSLNLFLPQGPQAAIGYRDIIDGVEVASKYQVVFRLKIPFAPFLSLMAFYGSFIVNPKYAPMDKVVRYVEGDARASNPNDLGPYLLTSWTRKAGKDYEMRFDANPNYWGTTEGPLKTKHLIIRFYSDATSLTLAMRSGDIDFASRNLEAADIMSYQTDPTVKVWQGPAAYIQFMCFQEKIPPFDNPKVRQAVAAALGREELVNTVFLGQAVPLYSLIPNGMAFHEDVFRALDPSFTVSILRELGYG